MGNLKEIKIQNESLYPSVSNPSEVIIPTTEFI